jgi:hypothetical protein
MIGRNRLGPDQILPRVLSVDCRDRLELVEEHMIEDRPGEISAAPHLIEGGRISVTASALPPGISASWRGGPQASRQPGTDPGR